MPPGEDPSWAQTTKPVLAFLQRPRSWKELRAHRQELRMGQNLYNNCLAWLENNGKAYSYQAKSGIRWAATGVRPKADPLIEDLIHQGLVEVVASEDA